MIFRETELTCCYLIEPDLILDERGCFARTFDATQFRERGLNPLISQCSISGNASEGTLRGLHYQAAPQEEAKLVRCVRGKVFDVAVDLREKSANFLRSLSVELSAVNRLAIYIPEGFAHGFLTLSENSELLYQTSVPYSADMACGVRWDDPALDIPWPNEPKVISVRDITWPLITSGSVAR